MWMITIKRYPDALVYIQKKNVIHRDLKPENILLFRVLDWRFIQARDSAAVITPIKVEESDSPDIIVGLNRSGPTTPEVEKSPIMKPSDAITSVASPASSNTTQLWTVKYRKNLEKRSDSWNFLDYGMSFAEIATSKKFSTKSHRGNIRIEEIFRDEYRLHRDRLKNRGGLFLEQLIEPYTNRMMKWSHFLAKNNLCKGPEPLWYKKLSEMVIDVEEDDRVVKHITSFQEILTRENNTKERIIAYIKTKRSRSKNYDEVGKHLIVHEELENENEKFNSPFLVNSTMTKGRKIENSGDESIVKPYMTSENIEAQNESVIESNIKEVKEMDANVMLIDDNKMDSMDNKRIRGFIGKEVIVNVGADIQKGRELCLNGFFGNELIPKNSDIDKFNFERKLRFVKSG
uniref:Protein kinase domain-containing protein n=1 Tax=Rhizophagus irregularis (strain DAOM 181602 / DAOM 197198 / MUCL 43194) TaxID=747089 RepID=U9SW05_RHIID